MSTQNGSACARVPGTAVRAECAKCHLQPFLTPSQRPLFTLVLEHLFPERNCPGSKKGGVFYDFWLLSAIQIQPQPEGIGDNGKARGSSRSSAVRRPCLRCFRRSRCA